MIDISVNLATHNRAAFLESCLISLCQQTLDPARYEICVVANACTDATPETVKKIAALYPHHRLFMVEEPVPGLSRARNCGIRATTGALVAHIDDDATAPPDWLTRFVRHFAEQGPDLAIVGGEIEPVWGSPPPDWLTLRMRCFLTATTGLGGAPRFLNSGECPCECNCCYRRTALEQVGGFPEELGRIGACLLSGENVIESFIHKNGGRVFFDPTLTVRHFIHADRLHPLWFRQRFFWQGISGIAVRQYNTRHGIPVDTAIDVNLPLTIEDWNFIKRDTANNIEESTLHFQWLGYVLALSGIMPIEAAS